MRRRSLVLALVLVCAACDSARVNDGHSAAAAGKWREAAEHFVAAVKEEPNRAQLWVFLGHARLGAGDPNAAREAYQKARSLDPSLVPAQLGLARVAVSNQEWSVSLDLLAPLVKGPSPDPEALTLMAMTALGNGGPVNLSLALRMVDRALAVHPDDPSLRYLKGCALVAARRYDEAQRVFDQLEQRSGQEIWGVWGQARLAAAQGRKADVLLHVRRAGALKASTFDTAKLLQDPAFTFMKDDPDFLAVLRR
jgi:Flp pilus assembly protein TadD